MDNLNDNKKVAHTSNIQIQVDLDDKNVPLNIKWQASDAPVKGIKEAKSLILALWNSDKKEAMRIDLWTHELPVKEMEYFIFQTIYTLGDTYQRATNNEEMADKLRKFAHDFGEELELFKKGE